MRLIVLLLVLLPGIAPAETTRATFDLYVSGIRAGTISVAGSEAAGRYAVAGQLESVGIVGAFRRVRYDAEVRGRVSGTRFTPRSYSETFRNGRRATAKGLDYAGGVPRLSVGPDYRRDDEDLDPATQGGTVDPLTAIWGVLRDVREGEACGFGAEMFDGARRSRIALGQPRRSGDAITCAGEYRRVAGYEPEELAEKARYPFRLTYRPAGDGGWQVERVEMDTIFGRGAMVRR